MDDVNGVSLIGQIVQSPFNSVLAAFGEVESDADFPILYHRRLLFVSLRVCVRERLRVVIRKQENPEMLLA